VAAHSVGDDEKPSARVVRLPLLVRRGVRPEVLILGANESDVGPEHGTNDKATGRAGLL
jgi:hypothetical protein